MFWGVHIILVVQFNPGDSSVIISQSAETPSRYYSTPLLARRKQRKKFVDIELLLHWFLADRGSYYYLTPYQSSFLTPLLNNVFGYSIGDLLAEFWLKTRAWHLCARHYNLCNFLLVESKFCSLMGWNTEGGRKSRSGWLFCHQTMAQNSFELVSGISSFWVAVLSSNNGPE